MNMTLWFWPETLMIEGGKVSWLHSLEELFILQNIADFKK